MTATRAQALTRALGQIGTLTTPGMCLRWTRTQYGIAGGTPDATTAWRNTRKRGTGRPPAGVPVFWTGGSHGFGHVAISDGEGYVIGTDAPTRGRIGRASIEWITNVWGLTYGGWADDLNGVTIPGAPAPKPPPPPAPRPKTRGVRIEKSLAMLRRAAKVGPKPKRNAAAAAVKILEKITPR